MTKSQNKNKIWHAKHQQECQEVAELTRVTKVVAITNEGTSIVKVSTLLIKDLYHPISN